MYYECYQELEKIVLNNLGKKKQLKLLKKEGGVKVLVPTRNLHEDKTILKIGARVLSILTSPKTLSSTWETYLNYQNQESSDIPRIQFDLFILALDFLYMVGAIKYEGDLLWGRINDRKNI